MGSLLSFLNFNFFPRVSLQLQTSDSLVVSKHMNVRDAYDVVKIIGKGSVSTIYEIRKKNSTVHLENDDVGHELYALKEVDIAKVDPRNSFDFFRNEMEILRSLDHQNVIRVYEFYTWLNNDGREVSAIVLELASGGDLHTRAPYSEQQVGTILYQLIEAVSYIHQRNIIHRDIKMENIMLESLDPDAPIKLIDFGLSTKFEKNQYFSLCVGTPYYFSPQVFMGHYDSQADMWAVGVIAFILLSGQKPFYADNLECLRQKIIDANANFHGDAWKEISADAKVFVRMLLEYDPLVRYTAERALKQRWLSQFKHRISSSIFNAVLSQLHHVYHMTDFEKLAWLIVARKADAVEVDPIRQVFEELDANHDGKITYVEFKKALIKISGFQPRNVDEILHKMDVGKTIGVDYTTFMATLLAVQGQLHGRRLYDVFDHLDVDNCGFITRDHLQQVLGDKVSSRIIDALMNEIDRTGCGKVDYDEFKRALVRDQRSSKTESEVCDTPPMSK